MKTVKQILIDNRINFKEKGADFVTTCLNPEHVDNHPSFHIDIMTGKYHCWSCGFKGNLFHLFNEEAPVINIEVFGLLNKIDELLAFSEGLEIPESASFIDVGFRGISASTLERFEVFSHGDYPGRICFPLRNQLTGKITNIIARSWESNVSPKYLAYPIGVAMPVFPLVESDTLYLVEGIFDMLNCQDKGYGNVACSFGTKNLNINNFKDKLNDYIILGTKRFVLLYDNDAAGIKSAKELAAAMNKAGLMTYVANEYIPANRKDPGELSPSELEFLFENISSNLLV